MTLPGNMIGGRNRFEQMQPGLLPRMMRHYSTGIRLRFSAKMGLGVTYVT
jgi:hypothetical protein